MDRGQWEDDGDVFPHGVCIAWDPFLIWLKVGSDIVIAFAYFAIATGIIVVSRSAESGVRLLGWMFAAFIAGCGGTHIMDAVTVWVPLYWIDAFVRFATAIALLLAAAVLVSMLPAVDHIARGRDDDASS